MSVECCEFTMNIEIFHQSVTYLLIDSFIKIVGRYIGYPTFIR